MLPLPATIQTDGATRIAFARIPRRRAPRPGCLHLISDMIKRESWLGSHALTAFGLLVDATSVAGMAGAIALTSGALLAACLAAGNLVFVAGTLLAYRGRILNGRE